MIDVMLDLETLGTSPDSIILSLGACIFYRKPCTKRKRRLDFYRSFDYVSQYKKGRTLSMDTLQWWLRQRDTLAFHQVFLASQGMNLRLGLIEFNNWLKSQADSDIRIWAHGASFDLPMLDHALKDCELDWVPGLDFRNFRDTRTLLDVCNVKMKKADNAHNAVDDAIAQAEAMEECFDILNAREKPRCCIEGWTQYSLVNLDGNELCPIHVDAWVKAEDL